MSHIRLDDDAISRNRLYASSIPRSTIALVNLMVFFTKKYTIKLPDGLHQLAELHGMNTLSRSARDVAEPTNVKFAEQGSNLLVRRLQLACREHPQYDTHPEPIQAAILAVATPDFVQLIDENLGYATFVEIGNVSEDDEKPQPIVATTIGAILALATSGRYEALAATFIKELASRICEYLIAITPNQAEPARTIGSAAAVSAGHNPLGTRELSANLEDAEYDEESQSTPSVSTTPAHNAVEQGSPVPGGTNSLSHRLDPTISSTPPQPDPPTTPQPTGRHSSSNHTRESPMAPQGASQGSAPPSSPEAQAQETNELLEPEARTTNDVNSVDSTASSPLSSVPPSPRIPIRRMNMDINREIRDQVPVDLSCYTERLENLIARGLWGGRKRKSVASEDSDLPRPTSTKDLLQVPGTVTGDQTLLQPGLRPIQASRAKRPRSSAPAHLPLRRAPTAPVAGPSRFRGSLDDAPPNTPNVAPNLNHDITAGTSIAPPPSRIPRSTRSTTSRNKNPTTQIKKMRRSGPQ